MAKRFIRCENYDECGVSYPLPARGKLSATGEVCEHCGAPVVVVGTARGRGASREHGRPGKEKKPARGKAGAKKPAAKPGTKKSAAKKGAAVKKPPRRRQRRRRNLQNASKPQIALYPGWHKPPGLLSRVTLIAMLTVLIKRFICDGGLHLAVYRPVPTATQFSSETVARYQRISWTMSSGATSSRCRCRSKRLHR